MSDRCAVTFQCNGLKSASLYSNYLGDNLLQLVDEFGVLKGFNTPDAKGTMARFLAWLNEGRPEVISEQGSLRTQEYSPDPIYDGGNNVVELDPISGAIVSFINMDDGKDWDHQTDDEKLLMSDGASGDGKANITPELEAKREAERAVFRAKGA